MPKKEIAGHIASFCTVMIWGTTFISTKVLLQWLTPTAILILRFALGYAALWVAKPQILHIAIHQREGWFAMAGLTGVSLYFLMENTALTLTDASHVGVMVAAAPFFTALFSYVLLHTVRPGLRFWCGFALGLGGVCVMSLQGAVGSLRGDLLALGAGIMWAAYSTVMKKISSFGYPDILVTRRAFFYGLLFLIPLLSTIDLPVGWMNAQIVPHLLFLGLGASALCFATWSFAVRVLGAVRTSVYIYLVPVITAIASAAFLNEPITPRVAGGIALVLAGLALSEQGKEKDSQEA